jgi:hypothetical protein
MQIESVSEHAGAGPDLKRTRRRKASSNGALDRLPPHSPEAEQGVLGCVLLSPNECLREVICKIPLPAFYDLRHQTLFSMLAAMYRDGIAIDVITLQQRLKDAGLLEQIGGIAYLAQLQDAVPSAANLSYYLDIVREKYDLRRMVQTCTDVVSRIYDHTGTIEDLKFAVQSDLGDVFGNGTNGLPDIMDAAAFLAQPLAMPPELIAGILHKGSKLALGGNSKAYKTWLLLDLAVAVATGTDWLGFPTTKGKVLYVNFEIQPQAWQRRIASVTKAQGVELKPGQIQLWNLRGHAADFRDLIPKIIARAKTEGFSLVVLDPIYKLYGGTADENSARDIAELLNMVERLTVDTGAAVAYANHFAKGNASGKEAQDRISGSGVFARDPDSLIIFTAHETEGAFTVETVLRNFAPVAPFVVQWNFPLMERAGDLDPADLKQVAGRRREHDPLKFLALIADRDEQNPISISEWALAGNVKRQTLSDYLPEMRQKEWIKTIGQGTAAKQAITSNGKALLKGGQHAGN